MEYVCIRNFFNINFASIKKGDHVMISIVNHLLIYGGRGILISHSEMSDHFMLLSEYRCLKLGELLYE